MTTMMVNYDFIDQVASKVAGQSVWTDGQTFRSCMAEVNQEGYTRGAREVREERDQQNTNLLDLVSVLRAEIDRLQEEIDNARIREETLQAEVLFLKAKLYDMYEEKQQLLQKNSELNSDLFSRP